ncbi:hypothetical protein D3C77_540970 [compost metagenome]
MGGQFFGVQRIIRTTTGLGLEQRRVSIAQKLFCAQCITWKQADANADTDKQTLVLDFEGLLHYVDNALRQCCSLSDLRALLGKHGKLVAAQACQGHAAAK